jgi:hypothetical protein
MEKRIYNQCGGGLYRWRNVGGAVSKGERQTPCQDRRVRNEAGFCKAGIQKIGDIDARRSLMSPDSKLSKNSQIEVLGLNKSSVYYVPKGESEENQIIMEEIDKEHLEHPTKGVVGMRDWLKSKSYFVGERRVRRLMRLMNIHAVYPIKSLSHLGMPE